MSDKKYSVYKHTNKSNGKVYIGITSMLPKVRWQAGYKDCKAFSNAIKKYGWDNFYHEIITTDLTKKEACDLEKALIQAYNSTDEDFGYNISKGGEAPLLGISPSDETREKLRKSSSMTWKNPEYREKHSGKNAYWYGKHTSKESQQKGVAHRNQTGENHPMFGKKHSEESRRKMSIARTGRFGGENHPQAKAILQYDVNGNFIAEYSCMKYAEAAIQGVHAENIRKCIIGKRKTAGGFIWKFKESEI